MQKVSLKDLKFFEAVDRGEHEGGRVIRIAFRDNWRNFWCLDVLVEGKDLENIDSITGDHSPIIRIVS